MSSAWPCRAPFGSHSEPGKFQITAQTTNRYVETSLVVWKPDRLIEAFLVYGPQSATYGLRALLGGLGHFACTPVQGVDFHHPEELRGDPAKLVGSNCSGEAVAVVACVFDEEGVEHGERVHRVPGTVGDYVLKMGFFGEDVFLWDWRFSHVVVRGIGVFHFWVGKVYNGLDVEAISEVEGDGVAHVVDHGLDSVLGILRSSTGCEPLMRVHDTQNLVDDELIASIGVEDGGYLDGGKYFAC